MKRRALFLLLVFLLAARTSIAAPQTHQPTQTASAPPMSQHAKWTQADKQLLLAKAARGDRSAQMWLGAAYEQGLFGKADFHEALKWFRKAAAQGDPDAQVGPGQMYADGEGARQNYTLAAEWYRRAAEHFPNRGGAGAGRNNLGLLYTDGLGVPKDYVQAYMWFSVAGSSRNLSYVKAKMTPAQILEAERLTGEWKRSHPE